MNSTILNELLAKKEAMESAASRRELWGLLFGIAVFVGVAGESWWGYMAWRHSKEMRSLQKEIDQATPLPVAPPPSQTTATAFSLRPIKIAPPRFGFKHTKATVHFGIDGVTVENIHMDAIGNSDRVYPNSGGFGPIPDAVWARTQDRLLLVSGTFWSDNGPVQMVDNQVIDPPSGWDINHNPDWTAIEVVDEKQRPKLQLIYKSEEEISILGIFSKDGRQGVYAVAILESMPMQNNPLTKSYDSWPRIFRYPSSDFAGVLEDPANQPPPPDWDEIKRSSTKPTG